MIFSMAFPIPRRSVPRAPSPWAPWAARPWPPCRAARSRWGPAAPPSPHHRGPDFEGFFDGFFRWNDVKWCEMMWNDVKNVCEDIMWRYVKWCEDVSHNEFQWGLTGFSGWNWWLWKNLKWMGGVKSMAEAMGCQEWILNGWINHWVRLNHRSCIKRQFHSCW